MSRHEKQSFEAEREQIIDKMKADLTEEDQALLSIIKDLDNDNIDWMIQNRKPYNESEFDSYQFLVIKNNGFVNLYYVSNF
jgi:hypothetical protein